MESTVVSEPSPPGDTTVHLGLFGLAAAAFVYVTAETLPIGLMPQLTAGLHVPDSAVGMLVMVYAAVAGLTAIPMTAWTNNRPRRQVVVEGVALLAVSQFVIVLAPNYAVVVGARVVCAFAHGVFWSVLASVAARLVAPGKAGRATAIVFTGNSLALVLGTPVATFLGQVIGWRAGTAVIGAVAAVMVVALLATLPPLASESPDVDRAVPAGGQHRPRRAAARCSPCVGRRSSSWSAILRPTPTSPAWCKATPASPGSSFRPFFLPTDWRGSSASASLAGPPTAGPGWPRRRAVP